MCGQVGQGVDACYNLLSIERPYLQLIQSSVTQMLGDLVLHFDCDAVIDAIVVTNVAVLASQGGGNERGQHNAAHDHGHCYRLDFLF